MQQAAQSVADRRVISTLSQCCLCCCCSCSCRRHAPTAPFPSLPTSPALILTVGNWQRTAAISLKFTACCKKKIVAVN